MMEFGAEEPLDDGTAGGVLGEEWDGGAEPSGVVHDGEPVVMVLVGLGTKRSDQVEVDEVEGVVGFGVGAGMRRGFDFDRGADVTGTRRGGWRWGGWEVGQEFVSMKAAKLGEADVGQATVKKSVERER